jgi:hypothetical protein
MSLCGATPAQRHGATDGARLVSLCGATPAQRHGATDGAQLMSLCGATPAQRHGATDGARLVSLCGATPAQRHGATGGAQRRGGRRLHLFSLALIDIDMALFAISLVIYYLDQFIILPESILISSLGMEDCHV